MILPFIIIAIYCSIDSCIEETDQTQCQKHSIEINDVSCFKYENPEDKNEVCTPWYKKANLQSSFKKYLIGTQKELYSLFPLSEIDEESYIEDIMEEGGVLKSIKYNALEYLNEDDKKIINNNNTCYYQMSGRLDPDYNENITFNISNKNVCFNVDRFEELKELIDCAYSTYKIIYKNKTYVFNNCFPTLDIKADDDFKNVYKEIYSSSLAKRSIQEVVDEFIEEYSEYAKVDKFKKRHLQNPIDYDLEMMVEDRHGNIIIYNKNGEEIGDDEVKKFLNSFNNTINNILLLFYLFLIILF